MYAHSTHDHKEEAYMQIASIMAYHIYTQMCRVRITTIFHWANIMNSSDKNLHFEAAPWQNTTKYRGINQQQTLQNAPFY